MVRSKDESPRGREFFYLVDRIRADTKYFPVSCDEVERALRADGYFDCTSDYECEDEGELVAMRLRLNVSAPRETNQFSWKIALKLHDVRIDGIDHHERLPLPNGKPGPGGWHRHEWDPRRKNADGRRVRIDGFDKGLSSLRMFLLKSFHELRIEVNRRDDGSQYLQFD
jgi:hypothetical protein